MLRQLGAHREMVSGVSGEAVNLPHYERGYLAAMLAAEFESLDEFGARGRRSRFAFFYEHLHNLDAVLLGVFSAGTLLTI
ncbi:MAG: hypothetical protein M1459_00435 [Patescibacteria group bacterium]|nr:hypothetical protein [Patescibacteria group bacterium]